MSIPQIRLKTEGFRAIKSADIILNGITVVTGENGCGKSTLSKLLYYLYKSASNYEFLVSRELKYKLRNFDHFFDVVISEIHSISKARNTREEFSELRELRSNTDIVSEEQLQKWLAFIERIENNYRSQPGLFKDIENPGLSKRSERLKFIIKDLLKTDDINFDDTVPFKKIAEYLKMIYAESLEKIKSRPTELFLQELHSLYSEGTLPKKFEVFEFEDQIVSLNKANLSIPYLIQNAIYIDTPMMFGIEHSSNEWDDLIALLIKKGKSQSGNISNTISNEIIGGNISLSESPFASNDFVFKRSDGQTYNLIDCATGIKAFAILQLLVNNGCLTDKTLLIIDEPESNLHPQWIIEYARIIVLLNKEIGVKFFIASHNPDMVSAIKYISEKEGIGNGLNFYLAEKSDFKYTYYYRSLGVDIEPIFASFNIAIDRINQYGS